MTSATPRSKSITSDTHEPGLVPGSLFRGQPLRTWPEKTQQAIADQVGCAQSFVAKTKSQFITSDKQPDAPATVTGKDGKVYPTSKSVETKHPKL